MCIHMCIHEWRTYTYGLRTYQYIHPLIVHPKRCAATSIYRSSAPSSTRYITTAIITAIRRLPYDNQYHCNTGSSAVEVTVASQLTPPRMISSPPYQFFTTWRQAHAAAVPLPLAIRGGQQLIMKRPFPVGKPRGKKARSFASLLLIAPL